MLKNILSKPIIVITLLLLTGVALASPSPAQGDPAQGAKLWADHCARCHNLRPPADYRPDQWRAIVSHMRLRAGFSGQDSRDLLAFLSGSSGRIKGNSNRADPKTISTIRTPPQNTQKESKNIKPQRINGAAIYKQSCVSCHRPNGIGAINLRATNSVLVTKSRSTLLNNAIRGIRGMPAKGGNPNLTDGEVNAAIGYMISSFAPKKK